MGTKAEGGLMRGVAPGIAASFQSSWTPAQGVNPKLWIKKSSAVAGTGADLASWTDLSGAGNNLVGAVAGPPQIVAGPPSGVSFSGVLQHITGPASGLIVTSATSFLGFAQVTPNAAGGSDASTYYNNPGFFGDDTGRFGLVYYTTGGHDFFQFGAFNGAAVKVQSSQADHGSSYVVQFWLTAGNLHIRVGNAAESTPVAFAGSIQTGSFGNFEFGTAYGAGGGYCNELLQEAAFFGTFDATTAANGRAYFGLSA